MALPGMLDTNFNKIHAANLEQQHMDTAAASVGQLDNNNNTHQNQGNEFILAAVSSTINLPGFWLDKPHT